MELARREMERFSLDTIRIFNPLDFTFRYKWDGRNFSVPAGGTTDVERYLANAYATKIIGYMIGQQQLVKGKELLQLRQQQMGKTFLDKYEENKEIWDRVPRLDDRQLIDELGETVILGLVEEFGMDDVPEESNNAPKRDETPFESLKKHMNRRIIDGEPMQSMEDKDAN